MRYLLFFFVPFLIFAEPLRVEVSAPSAILINAVTGKILYEKNAFVLRPPASTTKVATVWFLLEKKVRSFEELITVDPGCVVVVNAAARHANFTKYPAYRLETGGISFGLRGGEKLPFSLLIHAAMVGSANDAANALAHFYSSSVDQFMAELDAFLKSKGIVNTHYTNPHGLHHPDHKTTAFDLAQMARLAMQNPYFQNIAKTISYPSRQPFMPLIQTTNRLLRPGKFHYSKATGIKTGYIAAAGCNLVASAENGERKLIAVLMGCKTSEDRYKDAIALFEKAFSEKKVFRKLLTKEFDVFTTSIEGGESTLKARPFQDLLLEYFPSEEPTFEVKVNWKPKQMPILEGDTVGSIQIVSEKKVMLEEPLIAMNALHGTLSYRFFSGVKMIFGVYKVIWISIGMLLIIGLLFYLRIQKYLKKM